MDMVYLLLPLALLLVAVAVIAFIWAVRSGQLDDLETPARRVLHEDVDAREQSKRRETDTDEATRDSSPSHS